MFATILLLLLLIYISNSEVFGQSCMFSSDPLVRCTTQGLIRGARLDFLVNTSNSTTIFLEPQSVHSFLGIPYSEPPLGEKRFRKPISKRPWSRSTIFNATTLPNSCYQMILEVFNNTVSARQQQPLAVMVWIFGGGFATGSSTLGLYDGSILSSTQNVIVVSMEYRIDPLGFLYLGTTDAPGNQGLYDQQLALEWIYRNIKNFGGDPQRITLFGESSGAVSVGLHLLAPKSRSLFTNAILQSSGVTGKWAIIPPQIAKYRSEKFLDTITRYISNRYEAGENDTEYALIPQQCRKRLITVEEKFLCVKHYPILNSNHYRLSWALESYNGKPVAFTFVPTIDGDFIPYDPEDMLFRGDFKKCPILLGVNKDEGSYFNVYYPYGNMSIDSWAYVDYKTFQEAMGEYFRYIPSYPTERAPMMLESILQTYTVWNDYNNTIQNAIQLNLAVGDYHFTCPTIFLADIYTQENLPVYFYYFTLRSSISTWHQWMGVLHADEIMFIFGEPLNTTDNLYYTYEEILVSLKIMNYWANFAKYNNPNQRHDAQWANEWRLYKWPNREHIVLNIDLGKSNIPIHGSALRADYCAFWTDFIPKLATVTSNVSEDEIRWKKEFRQYQERVQQWNYYYTKYLEFLDKNHEKLLQCIG
ncbi:hypothetical protein I4U23_005993 [Adineta vaga]|nr:hypothetical protein I4U23_005993 [Adineta vaga]